MKVSRAVSEQRWILEAAATARDAAFVYRRESAFILIRGPAVLPGAACSWR